MAVLAGPAEAQRLPVRAFDAADGLADSRVLHLYRDQRGYLWIATPEGLSRFDGVGFVNYGSGDGLPQGLVNGVTEDHRGRLWVATNGGGLARLVEEDRAGQRARSAADRPFTAVAVSDTAGGQRVNSVLFDRRGVAWCATDDGLYRGVERDGGWEFTSIIRHLEVTAAMPGVADPAGSLWFGMQRDLVRVQGDAAAPVPMPDAPDDISALAPTLDGSLLVARGRVVDRRGPDGSWTRLPLALDLTQQVRSIHPAPDGALWIGTADGLVEWREGRVTDYGVRNGIADPHLRAIVGDRNGALWIGTWTRGLLRVATRGVATFTRLDGLPGDTAIRLVDGADGRMYVTTEPRGLAAIDGADVVPVPGTDRPPFSGIGRRVFQDSRGRWWLGHEEGVWLAPGPSLDLRRARKLGANEGLAGVSLPDASGVFAEDREGRIWISASPRFVFYSTTPGQGSLRFTRLPDLPNLYVRMTADRHGTIWMSSLEQIGAIRDFAFSIRWDLEGLPERRIRAFLEDRQGRLWVGLRYRGLAVADDASASPVRFRALAATGRLLSGSVWCLAEGAAGGIFVGTSRGVDRLDAATGAVSHLTAVDGLTGGVVNDCVADRAGKVWAATSGGVSRFDTSIARDPSVEPRVYLTGLTVAGVERLVAARGVTKMPPLAFGPGQGNVRVEFAALPGDRALRYQYRLLGAGDEWSPPTDERSVSFAQLAPGDYRFEVRAIDASGVVGASIGAVPFTVELPLWRRWWVLLLAATAVGFAVTAAHRFRLRQALAMERVRGQIATDLHDEVGSGLSQIAVLTEVARREAPPSAAPLLEESAGIARRLRESMSDIVWAVDPRKDHLVDLVQRMRQTTYNLLEVDGLDVQFDAPPAEALEGIDLPPDRRRHLLLVLKEAVTNIARHARASHARIALTLDGERLRLVVEDDGVGISGAPGEGRGLKNLTSRAGALQGKLRVERRPGGGTIVALDAPVRGPSPRMLG